MGIVKGYGGYYNNHYLRSSLEFAYAYYLDSKEIKWVYEKKIFTFRDGTTYKPDFYLPETDKFVEVKGSGNKEKGLINASKLKKEYDLTVHLIFYEDLLDIYKKEMSLRLNTARRMWKEEYGATLSNNVSGKLNPMYGTKHSEATKKLISKKAKERFESGDYDFIHKNMIQKNRERNFDFLKKKRSKRVTKECLNPNCSNTFEVTEYSCKIYCTHACARFETSKVARDVYMKEINEIRDSVRSFVISWCVENKDIVLETKMNKITEPFEPLYLQIKDKFNIEDKRTVTKSVLGYDGGRKEMLVYLKNYLLNT